MKSIIFCLCSLFYCGSATATLWHITDVLHNGQSVGSDGGFGYSSLHDADGANPMSGNTLIAISDASGTYDDVSGILDFTFTLFGGKSLALDGKLLFNGTGYLDSSLNGGQLYSIDYSGLTNSMTTSETTVPETGTFGFMDGDVCCGGTYDPNSFQAIPDDLRYMTLWGADYGGGNWLGDYAGSIVGMDFRVEMSAVPAPAAVWLFGTALIGLFSLQRRKAAT